MKPVKAIKVYRHPHSPDIKEELPSIWREHESLPHWLIPADAASYAAMVKQAAREIAYESDTAGCFADQLTVKAILAAIGIKEPKPAISSPSRGSKGRSPL